MTQIAKLHAAAQSMYNALEKRERADGETFYALADGSPAWMTDIVHKAHGDMMPDDWRYVMINDILSDMGDTEPDNWDDSVYEWVDRNTSIYNADLLRWLGSNLYRADYCDEAREAGYVSDDAGMYDRIRAGQAQEYREIADALIAAIRAHVEETDDDGEAS